MSTTKNYGPYTAVVTDVHDGDTITVLMDLGFNISFKCNCRLYGINAPELSTDAGKKALEYIKTLVTIGDKVSVLSHGWDKYGGRFDGVVVTVSGTNLAKAMLDSGNAVPAVY